MSKTVAARFTEYSRSAIELHNLVATRRPAYSPNGEGWPASVALDVPVESIGASTVLHVGAADAYLRVEVGDAAWRQLCSPWAGDERMDALPAGLSEAVRLTAVAPLLDWLSELTGTDMHLRESADIEPRATARVAVRQEGSAGAVMALLHLDTGATELLSAGLERLPRPAIHEEPPGLSLTFRTRVGRVRLSVRELRDLEAGDVLLMAGDAGTSGSDVLLLQAGRAVAVARLDGRRLTIERLLESPMSDIDRSEWTGAQDEPGEEADTSVLVDDGDGGDEVEAESFDEAGDGRDETSSGPLDPDELEIDLTFDLGRVSLPLADVGRIQAGYTFELDMPASGAVRILSGTSVIGQGELVQIDDRLGVRVTKLWKRPGD